MLICVLQPKERLKMSIEENLEMRKTINKYLTDTQILEELEQYLNTDTLEDFYKTIIKNYDIDYFEGQENG